MKELGAFKANMYLAEDRILCYEIVARKVAFRCVIIDHPCAGAHATVLTQNCNWILHYVKDAVAETDTPETLDVLIKQRRRWLNGSFFASLYTIIHFNRLWKDATHSLFMKCAFSVQFTYYFFNIGPSPCRMCLCLSLVDPLFFLCTCSHELVSACQFLPCLSVPHRVQFNLADAAGSC
jgi:cellulose synthase/poly-beta-1,6-N-acetylglucosamine synthase-like glycosyltransferase